MTQINHVLPADKLKEKLKVYREDLLSSGYAHVLDSESYIIKADLDGRSSVAARAAAINSRRVLGLSVLDVEWKTVSHGMVSFTPDQFLMISIGLDEWVEEKRKESWQ